ncbi:DUF559 domain-containing protein [Frankia sp. AiPs1]|uniref:hypothetical protein n=1 Tax=Frankia sp. AiPa1 TaxID=573492 RepID=UPI00202AE768|nr:hypothetical protein [Frankia sp. AiPa1]MCL9761041.1 hypothetical protein [Frankia sp. AiPa1]
MDQDNRELTALARRQDDVVTRRQARELGLTDQAIHRRRLRGGRSPIRGAMIVGPVRDEIRAHARAAQLVVGGTLIGLAAAQLHGLPGLPRHEPGEPVDLAIPSADRRRRRHGYHRHPVLLAPEEIVDIRGLRVSSIPRTLEDVALLVGRDVFIAVIDAMVYAGSLAEADLSALRRRLANRPGAGHAASWWPMIDGRAESPLETRLRLLFIDAGLLPVETQWTVRDPETRKILGRLDFAWPAAHLAIEADGIGPHSEPQALFHDRRRQNELQRIGWMVLRGTWADATPGSPAARRLIATIRHALANADSRHRPRPSESP